MEGGISKRDTRAYGNGAINFKSVVCKQNCQNCEKEKKKGKLPLRRTIYLAPHGFKYQKNTVSADSVAQQGAAWTGEEGGPIDCKTADVE